MSASPSVGPPGRASAWPAVLLAVTLLSLALTLALSPLVDTATAALSGLGRPQAAQASARLIGVASVLFLLLAELAVAGCAGYVLWRTGLSVREWVLLAGIATAWMLAAWSARFGKAIAGEFALAMLADLQRRETVAPAYWQLFEATNAAGALMPALIGAALGALAHRAAAVEPVKLAARTRQFGVLMSLAVVMLVAGTFFVFTVNRWAALAAEAGQRDAALLLASGMTMSVGVFYSAMLATGFVPTALLLNRAIDRHCQAELQRDPTLEAGAWRRTHRLEFSPLTSLRTYAAITTPMIASALQVFVLGPILRVAT